MVDDSNTGDQPAKRIHWTARGAGLLTTALWLLMVIGYAVDGTEPWTWESTVIMVLIIASTLGFVTAWWREWVGGVVLVTCAIAHSTFACFAAGHNHAFAMLISGGPYLVIGILFLWSWKKSRGIGI